MAQISVTLSDGLGGNPPAIQTDPGTGRVTINLSDGGSRDFDNATDLSRYAQQNLPTVDQALAILVTHKLANDPMFDSIAAVWNGKSITINPESANPFGVCIVT